MTFGSRLRDARKRQKLTQKDLALRIGAKHNSVSNWENDQNTPDTATIETLCGVLELTPNFLLLGREEVGGEAAGDRVSRREKELLSKYRSLSEGDRSAIDTLLDHYCAMATPAPAVQPVVLPPVLELVTGRISTQSVAAGRGTYLDDESMDIIRLVKNPSTQRAAFYVPVEGDSMEPKFHDGDILMVEAGTVRMGEIGIFTLDNNGYVKVCGDGELISLNPSYDPIPMNEEIRCNGRVMGVLDPDWIVEE